jgi:hypothetical protein
MRVMVRRDRRVRQRDWAATATACARDFGEFLDGRHPRAPFYVRNAFCGVNVHADDVRIFQ